MISISQRLLQLGLSLWATIITAVYVLFLGSDVFPFFSTQIHSILITVLILSLLFLFFMDGPTEHLLIWIIPTSFLPYFWFQPAFDDMQAIIIICLILSTAILLRLRPASIKLFFKTPVIISFLIIYILFFWHIEFWRYLSLQTTEAFDLAISNQMQWLSMHGHWLETSASGSNFATHVSPFLLLLTPLYALYPHPLNLLFLKTLLIALSVIPIYQIAKDILPTRLAMILALAFLFYPHVVGQHFNAPHETTFLPFILLWCFYFYYRRQFKPFFLFLLLVVSIKEHLAGLSLMWGILAFLEKRDRKWIFAPICLGLLWGLSSLIIISQIRQIYHVDPHPAWLLDHLSQRFLNHHPWSWENLKSGLASSMLSEPSFYLNLGLYLTPVLIFLPLRQKLLLLTLPEVLIIALTAYPLYHATWHYSNTISVFVFLAALLSCRSHLNQKWLRIYILSLPIACLAHFPLWWEFTSINYNAPYTQAVQEAISMIPPQASVKTSIKFAPLVSSRALYTTGNDTRPTDFWLYDSAELSPAPSQNPSHQYEDALPISESPTKVKLIYNKMGVLLYQAAQ